ncbi:MAG: hypothetical protein PHU77_00410 [Simplicispira sp.]|nr:hypothetical protein [Simplicispira sp.]
MNSQLETIARQHLMLETLETRNCGQDFKEVAVWCVKAALQAAFEAGQRTAVVGQEGGAASA